jgi:hypothetical protein
MTGRYDILIKGTHLRSFYASKHALPRWLAGKGTAFVRFFSSYLSI